MSASSELIEQELQPYKTQRRQLPADQIHGGSISLWDIVKRSLPIHTYEPLSILQAICEELRFAGRFLNKLHEMKEADQRMLQVVGFIISSYTGLVGRKRKPMNPMLGETFDFVHEDGWKYHAEQVSRHPSISVGHAVCKDQWEWFHAFYPKFTPSIDSATVQTVLPVRLKLANGDEYSWNKVAAIIHNVRAEAEKRQVKNEGKLTIASNTGIEAEIHFFNDEDNTIEGEVKGKDGKVLHRLVGNWDKGIYRLVSSGEKEPIFVATKQNEALMRQYGFSEFTVQLNELPSDQRCVFPPTDSRFRPDIRHLENADIKKAENAKKELEQAQRARVSSSHKPIWFNAKQDPFTLLKLWITNRQYWNSKHASFQDDYSRSILPLFPTPM